MIKIHSPARIISPIIIVLALIVAMLIIPNLRIFDEALLPEIQALPHLQPPPRSTNAIAYAYGMGAPAGASPQAAGEEIIALMHRKAAMGKWGRLAPNETEAIYHQRTVASQQPEDHIAIPQPIGMPLKPTRQHGNQEWWKNYSAALECNVFENNECFIHVRNQLATIPITDTRLELRLQRYRTFIQFAEFNDSDEMTLASPLADPMVSGRINLAQVYLNDPDSFLSTLKQDLTFWIDILRNSQSMMSKYHAISAIRYDLQNLNALLNEHALTPEQQQTTRQLLQAPRNLNFMQALRSAQHQFQKIAQIAAHTSLSENNVRMIYWLRQDNASANNYYEETTKPLMQLLQVKPDDFPAAADKLSEQKSRKFTVSPYNLGEFFLHDNYKSNRQFFIYTLAATYDLAGMYTLLELQLDIKQKQPIDTAAFIQSAPQRNPYTHKAMDYNPASGELGFACLNKRDVCNIYLNIRISTSGIAHIEKHTPPAPANETAY